MELQSEKQEIADALKALTEKNGLRKYEKIFNGLQDLQQDMDGDFYTVVVLGEFKRGKSTLVNALLGAGILPMNVLPETATINAIMYKEEPRLSVVKRDGFQVQGEVSRDFLQQYSAQAAGNEPEQVSYIKIGYPCEMLKNRVVLVDTPGVSDLNEQRSEVTYRFLPKANAVLFVLDANSPLKKTEKEFIEEKLLPLGINNILFVLNKYDAVDEEEEEDFLPTVKNRLFHAFKMDEEDAKLRDVSLIPFSAKWALEGLEKGNEKMVRLSGLPGLREKLASMLMGSRVEQEKVAGFRNRLSWLLSSLEREMEREYALGSSDVEELAQAAEMLRKTIEDRAGQEEKVGEYVKAAKARMFAMTDKSLRYFHGRLKENIMDLVDQYHSQDFKSFVEHNVARQVQRNVEAWLISYAPHLDEILGVMEHELALGFSRHFQQQVKLRAKKDTFLQGEKMPLRLEAADISQTGTQAGMITAVGMVFASLAITPIIAPFITLWGRNKLYDSMLGQKLEAAKAEIKPQLEGELLRAMVALTAQVHNYIDQRAEAIRKNAEGAYEALLEEMKKAVEQQLAEKRQQGEAVRRGLASLAEEMKEIRAYAAKFREGETK